MPEPAAQNSEIVAVRHFPLRELEWSPFERLCTYIITMDSPDARRLAAPDGGADTILEQEVTRVWQYKHMPHHISWPKCVASLDAAVTNHDASHVTYCFPRDLTAGKLAKFKSKLCDRHPRVKVDWWGETYLVNRLLSGPQGERIARAFFQDPSQTTERLLAEIRAGHKLDTGADVARVLAGIGSFAAGDPDFAYIASVREAGTPPPPHSPGFLVAVEINDGTTTGRIEATPRSLQVRQDHIPRFTIEAADTPEAQAAREQLDRILIHGGETQLGPGIRIGVDLDRLPPLMRGLFTIGPDATVVVSSTGKGLPPTWPATYMVEGAAPPIVVDIDMGPSDPPDGWDSAWTGAFAGFRIANLWRKRQPRGAEARWNWGWRFEPKARNRDVLATLRLAMAMRQPNRILVDDRSAHRPQLDIDTQSADALPWMDEFRLLLEDVVTIEEWASCDIPLPAEHIAAEEVVALREAATTIRTGVQTGVVNIGLAMSPEEAEKHATGPAEVDVVVTWALNVFDTVIPLGKLAGRFRARPVGEREEVEDGKVAIHIESVGDTTLELVRPPEHGAAGES